METEFLKVTQESIEKTCDIIKNGDVAAIPTETVYGLFADATKVRGMRKNLQGKGQTTG